MTLASFRGTPERVVYLGTPQVAVRPLQALVGAGFDVALVVSGADKRRGRGSATSPTPVKAAALELGIPVTDDLSDVTGVDADLGVVVAYGRIVPTSMLERLPMVNLHFSDLPRWRGAAPVEWTILSGDAEAAVCVMALEPELDTGAVFARSLVEVHDDETADSLRTRLVSVGTALLVNTLQHGLADPEPQQGDPTHAPKLAADDLRIDWDRPASELLRLVRVGGAWTRFRSAGFKVLEARPVQDSALSPGEIQATIVGAGAGTAIELAIVQAAGRARQDAAVWANGARLTAGDRFE